MIPCIFDCHPFGSDAPVSVDAAQDNEQRARLSGGFVPLSLSIKGASKMQRRVSLSFHLLCSLSTKGLVGNKATPFSLFLERLAIGEDGLFKDHTFQYPEDRLLLLPKLTPVAVP
jgi:hypothetical protein